MTNKPAVLKVDEHGREILDVTKLANRSAPLRAERLDRLGLVLSKLESPIVRADGKRVSFMLEDMVLSEDGDNELACVYANSYSYLSAKELEPFIKRKQPLFSFITVT